MHKPKKNSEAKHTRDDSHNNSGIEVQGNAKVLGQSKSGARAQFDISERHLVVMKEEEEEVSLACHYCDAEEETGMFDFYFQHYLIYEYSIMAI